MKIIDDTLLDIISAQAEENERLRINYNLHCSLNDKVQRLLNALEPGSILPVHRHKDTDETYFLIRGRLDVHMYDEYKILKEIIHLDPLQGKFGIHIKAGEWHTIEILEKGTVIFEVKEGPYHPHNPEDIMEI